ncbi:hypothetical protein AAFF_G00226200 [Aldrovandia affinis]|uniref:Cadherin domain-containing protein n=1 Tax=Aldrovandia affinis TaxID=143900 RepID=A0AAD7X282_9TELE|nr:hypothetical protein AAFF_G00226200 [Aldrovandia affinis]
MPNSIYRSMARFRCSVFGPTLLLLRVFTYMSCEDSPCQPAFTSDSFNFKVERTHLQKGRILGKVSFSDCGGPQRALFLSEDSRFKVDPDGTVSLKRAVILYDGHKSFSLHAWSSKGEKVTATVTVTHELRQSHHKHQREEDSITPEQPKSTPALPVLVFPKSSKGLRRRKRDWIIPPINFPENDRGPFPKYMVQFRSISDKEVQLQYSITGPGADQPPVGLFTIDRTTGVLYVTQPLDRETTDKYRLFAHAVAVGHGIAEDPMEILLNVIDQNDNSPEFTQDPFLGSVPEASPKGFEFMKVTAIDKDEPGSVNSDIRYKLVSQDPQKPSMNMFFLNPLTGGIQLNSDGLDREHFPKYTLIIEAADMEGHGLSSTCKAIITIIEGNNGGFFKVSTGPSKREGIITTAKALDFEEKSQHILSITVQSGAGVPNLTATVIVHVEDVNEAPVFSPAELMVVKPQSITDDSDLILYTATDPDTGRKQAIRYTTSSDPAGWLNVNNETGLIKLKSPMDRESPFVKDGKYKALIQAIDDDEVPRTGTGTLVIEL